MISKSVVVVLGSGRSGTSLIMQVLRDLGMAVSENLNEPSAANPLGPIEDKTIFDLHSSLIQELGGSPSTPMPENWLKDKEVIHAVSSLEEIMQKRLAGTKGVFGFKDPRTSMMLPLWVRVFNKLKVTPAYVLAVREPGATVASCLMQYNQKACMAELVWLVRMVEALDGTKCDCFIAHYEDWFTDNQHQARDLLQYTGLEQTFKGNLSEVLANTIKSNLNRTSGDDYAIQNSYVIKLYDALKECHGADFDRQRLMAVVKECRHGMSGFEGWYQLAHQANKNLADLRRKLASIKVNELHARIQALETEKLRSDQLAVQVQMLQRQLDQLMTLG